MALADEQNKSNEPIDKSPTTTEGQVNEKPPIVDHFACSDYCPGPREKYMVKVYKGVTDPDECRSLGGRPATYTGWGTFHICIAECGSGDTRSRPTPLEGAQ
jgi:hypothetical protein